MAGSSLSGVRTGLNFNLARLRNSQQGRRGAESTTNTSRGAGVSIGLRDIAGRRLISGAARSVNSAISSLNLAKDTLESLSSITSDLTALAERSAVRGVSNTQRSKLNARFERKTDEFRRVVDDAQIGPEDEDDLLTKDGLTEVFDSLGLDSDRSEAVADLLSSFIAADRTNSLANERVSVRAVTVPGVEQPPSNSSDRVLELVSVDEHSAGVTSGFIATDHNIFHSDDNITGQNSSNVQRLAIDSQTYDSVRQLTSGGSNSDALLDVTEDGYSLVRSSNDYLGHNSNQLEQLFIFDSSGNAVSQVTNFLVSDSPTHTSVGALNVSNGQFYVAYSVSNYDLGDNEDMGAEVFRFTESLGADPSGIDALQVSNLGAATIIDVDVNFSTTASDYVSFSRTEGASTGIIIGIDNSSSFTLDSTLGSNGNTTFGFVGSGQIALANGAKVDRYAYSAGSSTTIYTGSNSITSLATSASNSGGVFLHESTGSAFTLISDAADESPTSTSYTTELSGISTTSSVSIAANNSSGFDVGVRGVISEVHSTQQLYRLSQFVADTTAVAPLSSSAGKVLSFGIGTRQDAVRTLEYIEDLQTQIESNLAELDTTISALQDNAAVLRSARSVVDEVSQRIGDDASAAELAQGLQQAIQSDARLADLAHDSDQLAQSENLPLLLEAAQLRG